MANQQAAIPRVSPVPIPIAPVASEQNTAGQSEGSEERGLAVLNDVATAIFEAYRRPTALAPTVCRYSYPTVARIAISSGPRGLCAGELANALSELAAG
jgi:hypothetical protein